MNFRFASQEADSRGQWFYSTEPPLVWEGWSVVVHWFMVDNEPRAAGFDVRSYAVDNDLVPDHTSGRLPVGSGSIPILGRDVTARLPLGQIIREDRVSAIASLRKSTGEDPEMDWCREIAERLAGPKARSGRARDETYEVVAEFYRRAHREQPERVALRVQEFLELADMLPPVPDEFPDAETERKFLTTRRTRVRALIAEARKRQARKQHPLPPPPNRKGSQ